MTAELEGSLNHQNGMSKPTSTYPKGGNIQKDSSSELIRWRADQLLDEMMLGAVDVSAADRDSSPTESTTAIPESIPEVAPADTGKPNRTIPPIYADGLPNPGQEPSRLAAADSANGGGGGLDRPTLSNNGHNGAGFVDSASDEKPGPELASSEPKWMDDDWRPRQAEESVPANRSEMNGSGSRNGEPAVDPEQSRKVEEEKSADPDTSSLFSSALSSDLGDLRAPSLSGENFADEREVEDRANGDGSQGDGGRHTNSPGVGKASPTHTDAHTNHENSPGKRPTSGGAVEGTRNEHRSWQDSTLPRVQSGGGLASVSSQSVTAGSTNQDGHGYRLNGDSAVASGARAPNVESGIETNHHVDSSGQIGVYASPMSVSSMGKKTRTTLLPRMSTLDVESLNQEILMLHEEIREILPIGHETAERARHLLDKAHTILHSDPMRSAEVEYYMQQVRAIVQRIRQTYRWSNLYRSRLQLYLTAWALLSFVVLVARFLFPSQFEFFWIALTGMGAESAIVRHLPVILATLFAGAMGGAIGALYTMLQHAQREYGFFDRKYGLRGIMLPIIGAIVGGLLYALFAAIFQVFGITATGSVALGLLPAILAMIFGLGQESLYGTRS